MNLSRLFKSIFLIEFITGLYLALKELFRVTKYGGSTFVYLGFEKPGLIEKYIFTA